ncbi:hypothetical protein B0H14DRAFT_2728006 [Mycena olivaceomarginata]|nr:hypothetical protein B0H14DRAFT_2728006 [Mycena olivaceomarginata]
MASKRMSQSFITIDPPHVAADEPDDAQKWVEDWRNVLAKDLIDSRIVEILLSEKITCLAVKATEATQEPYLGLFDWGDVNAFLTLAATRHTLGRDDLLDNSRADAIVSAARAGHVPTRLVSISLLEIFSRGAHRVLIRASDPGAGPFLGIVSDRRLLTWFAEYTPTAAFLETPLHSLSLPSLHLFSAVVTATSSASVLDAMRLMSEDGVSSIAVLDDDNRVLLSAFIALIKAPDGSTDGADRYPVYAVSPTSLLSYTIQKLLASTSPHPYVW